MGQIAKQKLEAIQTIYENVNTPYILYHEVNGIIWNNTCCNEALLNLLEQQIFSFQDLNLYQVEKLKHHESIWAASANYDFSLTPIEQNPIVVLIECHSDKVIGNENMTSLFRDIIASNDIIINYLNKKIDDDDYETFRYVEKLIRNNYKLLKNINNISYAYDGRGNDFSLDLQHNNFTVFFTDLMQTVQNCVRNSKIKLTYRCDQSPLYCYFDEKKLAVAILNLISNSFMHTRDGNTIEVGFFTEKNKLHIFVKDKGVGMTLEQINRVFQSPLAQQEYRNDKGIGLGFYVTKKIIKLHKGDINISSEYGVGSEVKLEFPLELGQQQENNTILKLRSGVTKYGGNRFSDVYVQLSDFCVLPF